MAAASKVRDWMRKRMMPRKAAGSGKSGGNSEASPLASSAQSASPRRKHGAGPFSSALRWKKPHGNVMAELFRRVAYHLLWLVESVVVVAQLFVFFVRFGFRL